MLEKINALVRAIEAQTLETKENLEQFRLEYLSRKGKLTDLFDEFKTVAPEIKKEVGQELNKLKQLAQLRFDEWNEKLQASGPAVKTSELSEDLTLPVIPMGMGSRHPLTQTRREMITILERMGFNLSEGPEIEDDWHNFTALNFPENHPAREMQDTFFIEKNPDITLRTHTSSVQVRVMEGQQPPIRTISPGRVYRNEAISARAHCVFHQIEGLYVDRKVSFADLKNTLYHFVRELFGTETKIRFRPSFFPFTEPSAEMDISCLICKGAGCNVCKQSGWVEIGGAGMVDPAVLANNKIDPETYTGFAFGMGIERITMLKYQIRDLRLFTENDLRFLRQFKSLS